ncbi:MAG: hypothetical protein H6627_06455 [Calditrichae bacterium]|nr:hypothetical protein [Calditrichia bacterium]
MKIRTISLIIVCTFLIFNACQIESGIDSIDDSEPKTMRMAVFSYINNEIISNKCAVSGCHLNNQIPIMRSDLAYNNLVNKPSTQGLDYIEPGDPDNSYLYKKITGAASISGARMPRGQSPLPQAVTDSIRVWILNGALNN